MDRSTQLFPLVTQQNVAFVTNTNYRKEVMIEDTKNGFDKPVGPSCTWALQSGVNPFIGVSFLVGAADTIFPILSIEAGTVGVNSREVAKQRTVRRYIRFACWPPWLKSCR